MKKNLPIIVLKLPLLEPKMFSVLIRNPNPKYENGFNIYGTWRQVTFEKLMMKVYDFFIRLSRLVTPYNIVQKSL